jgi:esterase
MEEKRSLITKDGVRVAYRLWHTGRVRHPLIILLHGLASNMTRWSEFLEYTLLKSDWDIIRLDLRGHGESLHRGNLGIQIWCQDLLQLLETEGYPEVVLIGHSLGAQLALHFAYRYPEKTAGVVLIDPVLGEASHGPTLWARRLYPVVWLFVRLLRTLNRVGLHRRYIPARDLRQLDEQTRATLLNAGKQQEMIRRYSSPWPDLQHFPTANFIEEILVMVEPLPPLSRITAPVLVVLSKGVTYTDPETSRRLIANFRNASTVVIDAYHWPLTERPDEVRQAIERWCAELRQRKAKHVN